MNEDLCWECRREAPSGVCMGPHPDFDLRAAVRAKAVDTCGMAMTFEGNHGAEHLTEQRKEQARAWVARERERRHARGRAA